MVKAFLVGLLATVAATVGAADSIAVAASPLGIVTRLEHVDFVMHRGKVLSGGLR